ncbi:MAG: RloB domain-containing protein [Thiomargarita sp.]|nr:RloB domain-containing protein [Thiomargarita sp.]
MALTQRKKRPINRKVTSLRDTRLLIIATEGRKTEKKYFSLFRNTRIQVKIIPTGDDDKSAPEYVLERLKKFSEDYELSAEDELWLMIDVDSWKNKKLSYIAAKATSSNFKLAISNPCFEIWLLCHHIFPNIKHTCCKKVETQLNATLKERYQHGYKKNNIHVTDYKDHLKQAIKNAKQLDNESTERWPKDIGTHVYKIVQQLVSTT